jgi:hypothetical protein
LAACRPQVVLQHADRQAADHVDEQDQQAGDGVAAHVLAGTVHGTEEVRFLPTSARRRLASFSSIRPAFRSASIAICLPGIASSVKRAPTSAIRSAPLVTTMKLITTRIAKHDQADREVAADQEVAEGLDHLAGRAGPV